MAGERASIDWGAAFNKYILKKPNQDVVKGIDYGNQYNNPLDALGMAMSDKRIDLIPGVSAKPVVESFTGTDRDTVQSALNTVYPTSPAKSSVKTTTTDTGVSQEEYNQWLIEQQNAAEAARVSAAAEAARVAAAAAETKRVNTANEVGAYNDQITELQKLLGHADTREAQGIKSINDLYDYNKGLQDQSINAQRLANTQAKEKGYNEVGNFANTSYNNLNRLLQGNNAGRSSVGQVLMPYMVGRSADTRRNAVTDTAGENEALLQTAQDTGYQNLQNTKNKSLSDYLTAMGNSKNSLTEQMIAAQNARDMANGQNYEQARAGTANLRASVDSRTNELTALFDKYKPDYKIQDAPDLTKYQVDPAKIQSQQTNPNESSFYLSQLKKRKELGL